MEIETILVWSELIAYITASLAAFIYICDTTFVYASGLKRHFINKNREKRQLKENGIIDSLGGSSQSPSPTDSIILNGTDDRIQHPLFRRNIIISRSVTPSHLHETPTIKETRITKKCSETYKNPLYIDNKPQENQ
jgi:hypothetical protein